MKMQKLKFKNCKLFYKHINYRSPFNLSSQKEGVYTYSVWAWIWVCRSLKSIAAGHKVRRPPCNPRPLPVYLMFTRILGYVLNPLPLFTRTITFTFKSNIQYPF